MKTETNLQTELDRADEPAAEQEEKKALKSPASLVQPDVQARVSPKIPPTIQPQKPVKKMDFSVDYNIPTLDEIALPGDESIRKNQNTQIPIPKHILDSNNIKEKNDDITLSPEQINQLSRDLQKVLITEIEKSVTYALNSALATVMDQTSKITKNAVRKRIEELLPKLLKEHLENISQNNSPE